MRSRTPPPSTPRTRNPASPRAGCSPEHPAASCIGRWSTNIVYGVEDVSLPMRIKTRIVAALGEGAGAALDRVERVWNRQARLILLPFALFLPTLFSTGCSISSPSSTCSGLDRERA